MALGEAIGIGVGLVPSLFKAISGIGQARRGRKMNPIDPGYTLNSGIIDNARVLEERAGNYTMPGYGNAVNQIGGATASAFDQGVQGASSGGDVLDLATKLAYGQQQQLNNLNVQNAAGADQALMQSLDANAAAGQQYQDKNAYARDQYQAQLREKAALMQAGNENIYGALDQAATVGSTLLNPRKTISGTNDPNMTTDQVSQYNIWKARNGLANQNIGLTKGLIG